MVDPREASEPSEALIRRAQQGERTALDTLMRRSLARLLRLTRARLGPRLRELEDSGDLVQSALREAVRDLPGFVYRGRQSFHRWLATIVEHKIRHRARDRGRARRDPGPDVRVDRIGEQLDTLPADAHGDAAVAAETREGVRDALEQLDEAERDVIVWRQFQQLSTQQVAELLGTSAAAASKRYCRALERLRVLLEARGIGPLV
jgi:RNA polymerase sigma-70 factor (ECF subfamily)